MRFTRNMVLLTCVIASACNVWKTFDAEVHGDAGLDGVDVCGECTGPWWNHDYAFRATVMLRSDVPSGSAIVLPIVLNEVIPPDALQQGVGDVRVVLRGEELPTEIGHTDGTTVVVWSRFAGALRSDDPIEIYWGNPDAVSATSPWHDHPGAFHLEDSFDSAVPGGDELSAGRTTTFVSGRIGRAASLPDGDGLRLNNSAIFDGDAVTTRFSVRGTASPGDELNLFQIPQLPCRPVLLTRDARGRTNATWTEPQGCEDDVIDASATIDIDVLDGTWHDIVLVVDTSKGRMELTIDDRQAAQTIAGATPATDRAELRGPSTGSQELFEFDEFIVSNASHHGATALAINLAIRGELFEVGPVQTREESEADSE